MLKRSTQADVDRDRRERVARHFPNELAQIRETVAPAAGDDRSTLDLVEDLVARYANQSRTIDKLHAQLEGAARAVKS